MTKYYDAPTTGGGWVGGGGGGTDLQKGKRALLGWKYKVDFRKKPSLQLKVTRVHD